MALDNAEFISELSILDPPGTDPLNEGDNHLRTIKKATQQSFPNVGSAVPQTGQQMAQMAIKNEVNIFTQQNTFQQISSFQQVLRALNGSVTAPPYSFTSETGTGMHHDTAGRLSFATLGALRFLMQADQVQALAPFRAVNGSAAATGYGFTSDAGMGMFRAAAGLLDVTTGGTSRFRMSSAANISFSLLQASANDAPSADADVITKNSQFTFNRIIGFASTTFHNQTLTFNDIADVRPKITWQLNAVDHWNIGTVGLGGVSWAFTRFSDVGAFLGNPFRIFRLTGQIEMGELPTSNPGGSGILWKNGNVVNVT